MIMVNNRYKMVNVVKNTTDFGEKDLKSNAEINNAELKITIAKNEDMLVFNSNEDFQNAISKLNAAPTVDL